MSLDVLGIREETIFFDALKDDFSRVRVSAISILRNRYAKNYYKRQDLYKQLELAYKQGVVSKHQRVRIMKLQDK